MTSKQAADNAIYRALGGTASSPVHPVLIRPTADWRHELSKELDGIAGDALAVVPANGLVVAAGRASRGRRMKLIHPWLSRAVERHLERQGWDLVEVYLVWPSGSAPRVAASRGDRRVVAWMQETGVIGGGQGVWTRALLRTPLARPLIVGASAKAYLVTRKGDGSE